MMDCREAQIIRDAFTLLKEWAKERERDAGPPVDDRECSCLLCRTSDLLAEAKRAGVDP